LTICHVDTIKRQKKLRNQEEHEWEKMSSRFYGIMTNCLENAENTVNVLAPDQCELGQSMRKKLYELQLLLLLTDERKNVAYEQCLLMRMMKQQKICQGEGGMRIQ